MKKLLFIILFTLLLVVAASAQTTTSVRRGTTLPSTCNPTTTTRPLFFLIGTGLYQCSAVNTWTPVGNGATGTGGGTGLPTKIKVANDFTGADIGAKINAADAACGQNVPCEIWAFGGGAITTPIVIGSFHKLKLHDGTYICNTTPYGIVNAYVAISLKDNSSLEGASWNTIIIEPVYPSVYRVVQAFNTTIVLPTRVPNVSLHNTAQSDNISVKNIQFKGVRTNPHDGGNEAAIEFGNTHVARVENCWFNATSGYGAHFGGNSTAGFHAEQGWYLNNLHTNLMSQNVAASTIEGLVIEGNIFRDPGKPPYTITNATNTSPIVLTFSEPHHLVSPVQLPDGTVVPGTKINVRGVAGNTSANGVWRVDKISATQVSLHNADYPTILSVGNGVFSGTAGTGTALTAEGAAVDIEPNGDSDPNGERIYGVTIKNNIFDFRNINTEMTAIAYQMTGSGMRNEGALIEGNIMLGNETGAGQSAAGIFLGYPSTKGLTISNNYIYKFSKWGMLLRGVRIKANNNQMIFCGSGGIPALEATDLEYSTIENNIIANRYNTNRTGTGAATFVETGQAFISETGLNRFNTWSGNTFGRLNQKNGTGTGFNGTLAWSATDSIYKNNTITASQDGGLSEGTNSDRNIYDGNVTDVRNVDPNAYLYNLGLVLVGAASKVLSHKYTDGTTVIPRLVGGTPAKPTNPIVNDTANTFDWTNSLGFQNVSDYEYTVNGGASYAAVTTKPIGSLAGSFAAGQVGVRVKAANGVNASATLYNPTGYIP
jgi:hypothetical protein